MADETFPRLLGQGVCARVGLAAIVLAAAFGSAVSAEVPATAPAATAAPAMRTTPTTRILAIGHLTRAFRPGVAQATMPQEVRDTVELYLNGKISDWYVRKDQPGVVFILDLTDATAARDLLAQLPLVKAGQLEFDLIPLGPLAPLSILTH